MLSALATALLISDAPRRKGANRQGSAYLFG
jgi:hypothetical protein